MGELARSAALTLFVAVSLLGVCAEEAGGLLESGPQLEIFEPVEAVAYGDSLWIYGRVIPSPDTGVGAARVDTLSWNIPELGKMAYIMFHRSGFFVQSIPISKEDGPLTLTLRLSDEMGRIDEWTLLINPGSPAPGVLPPTPEVLPPAPGVLPPAPGVLPPTPEVLPPTSEVLPPAPIKIESPTDGSFFTSTVEVTGSFGGAPLRIEWRVDALDLQGPAKSQPDGVFNFAFSTAGFSKPIVVEVRAIYDDGMSSASIRLENIGDGPYLDVKGIIDGDFYLNQIEVTGVIGSKDTLSEVKTLSWRFASMPENRRSIFFDDEGLFSLNIDLSNEEGLLSLEFEAEDRNGNKTRLNFRLRDGRLPPQLTLEFPTEDTSYGAAGMFVSGTVIDPYEDIPDYGGLGDLAWMVRPMDVRLIDQFTSGSIQLARDGSFLIPLHMQIFEGDVELHIAVAGANGAVTETALPIPRGKSDVSSFRVLGLDKSARLSWDSVPDADRLVVELADDDKESEIEVTTANNGELVVDSLINGELYEFQLRVISARGNFSSHVARAIPLSGETLKPIATGGYRQIQLKWPSIPGTQEYFVFRSEGNGDFTLLNPPISKTSFLDSKARYGVQYSYAIAPVEFPESLSNPTSARTLQAPKRRLEVVARYGGVIPEDIYLQGDYAFVAAGGNGLRIIDINDPIKPVVVGRVESERMVGIAVRGDYAFISDRNEGLLVANIVAPTKPFVVGSRLAGQATAIAIRGDYAYITDEQRGLRTYDVSNTRNPQRIGVLEGFDAYDLAIVDATILVPAGLRGLAIIGLENPGTPTLLSTVEAGDVRSIEIRDNLACLIDSAGDILLLDISNPQTPRRFSRIAEARAKHLAIEKNYILVSRLDGGLDLYNVDNPSEPTFFGTAALGKLGRLAFKDDYIYAGTDRGIIVIQTYLVGNSFVSSGWETQGLSYSLALSDRELVVADHKGGVSVFNSESDVGRPTQVIQSSFAMNVALMNDFLAVADAIDGLSVYSRLPNNNRWSESILEDAIGPALDVDIYDTTVIAAFEGMNPVLLQISEGAVANSIEIPFLGAKEVSVGELFAAVANGQELRVYGVGDFVELERFNLEDIKDLHIYQNQLYAVGDFGMAIYAFLDSGDFKLLSLMSAEYVHSISVAGGFAFLSCGPEGLLVVNVKDPTQPFIASRSLDVFATAAEAIPGAGRVYVANIDGVQVVDLVIPSWLE